MTTSKLAHPPDLPLITALHQPPPLQGRALLPAVGGGLALEDLGFSFADGVEVLRTSEGRGWSDLAGFLTNEPAHHAIHRPLGSLWIGMALDTTEICRNAAQRVQQSPLLAYGMMITPPSFLVEDTVLRALPALHVFLEERVLQEVADELYGRSVQDFDYLTAFGAGDAGLAHLMRATKQMLRAPDGSHWRSEYLARALAAQLLSGHVQFRSDATARAVAKGLSRAQLRRVKEFLLGHIDGQFAFADLATSIGLSRTSFFNRFAATARQTPHQYLQSLRIEKAKEALRHNDLSLADVALTCGFSDQNHLSRFFKRHVGTTPGRYRSTVGMKS